jgi:hypothetical protein
MPLMVPTGLADGPQLAAVLPSCVAALRGEPNELRLPPAAAAIVVVIDGLGTANLRERSGHARFLAAALGKRSTARTGGPTTTAAALTSLMTGTSPGSHGVVGYTALDPVSDRVVNQLSGWGTGSVDPLTWQRSSTVFERANGIRSTAIGASRYRSSGFTEAILRGAEYVAADDIGQRFAAARDAAAGRGPSLSYLYIPELDMAAHAGGTGSERFLTALETVDAAVREAAATLPRNTVMLVTADHGMLDVGESAHVLIDERPRLVDGIRHVAGDPRLLALHFEPDLPEDARERLVQLWRDEEGERAWVLTRAEAIEAGVYGPVDDEVAPRIGDLLIAARGPIAYYDGRTASDGARSMVGQHGSFTAREREVPLLRFGAGGA